ncbi:hypothetical protein R6Z07M_019422 [Ovis aries]
MGVTSATLQQKLQAGQEALWCGPGSGSGPLATDLVAGGKRRGVRGGGAGRQQEGQSASDADPSQGSQNCQAPVGDMQLAGEALGDIPDGLTLVKHGCTSSWHHERALQLPEGTRANLTAQNLRSTGGLTPSCLYSMLYCYKISNR